jgi:flagellar biosynthesis component FlhA
VQGFYNLNALGSGAGLSTKVIGALGTFIAVTTITLLVITLYMMFRVYRLGKTKYNANKNAQQVPQANQQASKNDRES